MVTAVSLAVPTLAETLERGLDPSAFIGIEFLGEYIGDSMANRHGFGSSKEALLRQIAAIPSLDNNQWRSLLHDVWRAELIEDPDLIPQVIDAVTDPGSRLVLLEHRRRGIQLRHEEAATDARRRSAWRAAPEGGEWHDLDEISLMLYASETGAELDEAAEDVMAELRDVVEGLFPTIETRLRPLVPQGVDLQLKVST